jgi:glycosyltransferase involved in cell wall biosynthesis
MPGARLSLALIVRNEARCLARCLRNIQPIVSETVVVDTGSTDDTVRIAREHGAIVHHFTWIDDFAAARNFAIQRTAGDWILMLDADEYAGEPLAAEIGRFICGPKAIGRLRIVSAFRRQGRVLHSQSFVSRLFPRGACYAGRIHEQLVSPLPRRNLRSELWHDGYLETSKSDRNVRLLRRELEEMPESAYLLFQLGVEYSSLNQTADALRCFRRACELVRPEDPFAPNVVVDYLYAAGELGQFEEGLRVIEQFREKLDDFPDFHLARGLFYMNLVRSDPGKYLSYLEQIEGAFQRCLALGETPTYQSVQGTGSFLAHYNLGVFYHVFGQTAAAGACFEAAARMGYEPAAEMLRRPNG